MVCRVLGFASINPVAWNTLGSGNKIVLPQNSSILLPFCPELLLMRGRGWDIILSSVNLKQTRKAKVHPMKTQCLYVFTALKKSDSTSRFCAIFDSHALNCLSVSSVQNCHRTSVIVSYSWGRITFSFMVGLGSFPDREGSDQSLLLLIISDVFGCTFLNYIKK